MSAKRLLKNPKAPSKSPKTAAYDNWVDTFRSDRKQIVTFFSKMLDAFVYCRILPDKAGNPLTMFTSA
jgi:hypothetical protein